MDSQETVYEADSSLEASVIENLLKTNGVTCSVHQAGTGVEQYHVQVKNGDQKRAEQIILDYHDTSED